MMVVVYLTVSVAYQFNRDTIGSLTEKEAAQRQMVDDIIAVADQVRKGTENAMNIVKRPSHHKRNDKQPDRRNIADLRIIFSPLVQHECSRCCQNNQYRDHNGISNCADSSEAGNSYHTKHTEIKHDISDSQEMIGTFILFHSICIQMLLFLFLHNFHLSSFDNSIYHFNISYFIRHE